jgi:two-component system chemotaxis sensor kinase CheA
MYLVSELVTTKSELMNALTNEHQEKALVAAEKIEKLTKMFSENALNLRLVSVHEMTEKFKRLVRDVAKQLGKHIHFIADENNTELDKSIIDHIGEPIMHLIRNCVDHGIELPHERKTKGKPETGVIKFETIKTGNYVHIRISDDGNGIDTDAVYKKAVEKGFISPGTQLTEKETLELIFLPGFSTAQNLSNISGRGVGMDIVLKKIQEIRGEISITSIKGTGTTFAIKLQQSISIIDTLLVKALDVTYAIPVEDIESCILEPHANLVDKQNHLFNNSGELIPYLYIESPVYSSSVSSETTDKMVIIKKHDRTYGLVVDSIIGEYQAVIKPLGQAFNKVNFISGASLLGDGSIALLLDTDKLTSHI